MNIKDIMSTRPLVTVRPDDELGLAAQMMIWAEVRHLPVVRHGEVVGVLSERDLLHHYANLGSTAAAKDAVSVVMRSPAVTVGPEDSLATASTLLLGRKIGCLPVVGRDGLAGIVTRSDLLRSALEQEAQRASAQPTTLSALMKRAPAAVTPDTTVIDAAVLMRQRGARHLPVIDAERRLVGMISDRDLRVAIGDPRSFLEDPAARRRAKALCAADVMARTVISLPEQAPIGRAIDLLANHPIGAIPVVDEHQRLTGIVSYVDVIQALR